MKKKKVIIIGAGPGGLSCGMILAKRGFDVNIYEKNSVVGGRNASIRENGFVFDLGPTFFLMKDVLENIFELCDRNLHDYLNIVKLDPMYRLQFKDKVFFPSTNESKMIAALEKAFPGSSEGYKRYMTKERKKYDKLIPCLEVPYGKLTDFLHPRFISALPYVDFHKSLFEVLGRYFDDEQLRICFTFQAKYIGMSPWQAPGLFSIISFIEHGGGVFHVMGGLNQLSQAMAKVASEHGASLILNKPVKKIIIENRTAKGVEFEDGETAYGDYIVINSDFAYSMNKLVDNNERRKYDDNKLKSLKYSCSTFMIYLGLDKLYDNVNHHNIFFADNYKKNVEEITDGTNIIDDPSFYVHNPSITDNSLAPEGKSAVYVLVPVGNTTGGINWAENKEYFKDKIINLMETKAGMKDIRNHIEFIRIITPQDWQDKMNIYNGATFNLGHNIGQMLYFRPHNEFEEFKNCYLVGGGTHPGSGLPTIYESGRISAELISKSLDN